MSVATKLIAAIVGLLVAAVGAAGVYSTRRIEALGRAEATRQREDGETATRAQVQLVVRHLASSAGLPLAESNYSYLGSLAGTALRDEPRILWLQIADDRRRVVARAGSAPGGESLEGPVAGAGIAEIGDGAGSKRVFAAGVFVGERAVGEVRLAISTADLDARLAASIEAATTRAREAARELALVAAIIVLCGAGIGWWQGLRIVRPLAALTRQAGQIAAGDFDQRVAVTTRDELGALASSFNSMASSLGGMLAAMSVKASMERELELARSVQELMSPSREPVTVGDFQLAGYCEAATQCGGDWWTYKQLDDGRLLVVIGDVTGHGLPAAMIAATARGAVQSLALLPHVKLGPRMILEAIDGAIHDVSGARLLMTCFVMVLDVAGGTIHFANAGHVFPYVAQAGQESLGELSVLAATGNPLGGGQRKVREVEQRLVPGQVIVLTTDGLVDRVARSGERFGDRRLRKLLLASAADVGVAALRDEIITAIHGFADGNPADDDTTLVVLRYDGPREPNVNAATAARP